jgi:nicotinamidase-related amidase
MSANSVFTFTFRQGQLVQDAAGHNQWQSQTTQRTVPANRVAILICDMWDNHWSRGAVVREAALIPPMNRVVAAARARGAHIIHAPSETMEFYQDHPARRRMLATPPVAPPADRPHENPALPVDASDYGSDTGETTTYKAWRRQHPDLVIDDERDLISDNGREIYSYLLLQQIDQVLIMGVHTNMCILNRSFAIKQMVRWGVAIALVRDLTDTMYNPAMPPYVSHDEGTALVIGYIEKFWCPSISSRNLLEV